MSTLQEITKCFDKNCADNMSALTTLVEKYFQENGDVNELFDCFCDYGRSTLLLTISTEIQTPKEQLKELIDCFVRYIKSMEAQ